MNITDNVAMAMIANRRRRGGKLLPQVTLRDLIPFDFLEGEDREERSDMGEVGSVNETC